MISIRDVRVVLALSLVGAATHFVPHPMGVSTVGAIGMLAVAYAPRALAPLPVLATTLLVDLALGHAYGVLAMSIVYAAHLAAALAAMPLLRWVRPLRVVGAAGASATAFYLISNLQPLFAGYYPATAEGIVACYVNGLPFLARGLAANLIYGGLAFAAIESARRFHAHRHAAA